MRVVTSQPAAIAASRSRPERRPLRRSASAGGITSGVTWVMVGAMDVAHRHGGNQIAVEQRRAGERQPAAADDAGFVRLRERRRERRDLMGLLALVARERAGQRIEQQRLAMLAHLSGQIVMAQPGRELGQRLRYLCRH